MNVMNCYRQLTFLFYYDCKFLFSAYSRSNSGKNHNIVIDLKKLVLNEEYLYLSTFFNDKKLGIVTDVVKTQTIVKKFFTFKFEN